MDVINLKQNQKSLKKVIKDINTINKHKEVFFWDGIYNSINQDALNHFEKVKSWEPLYRIDSVTGSAAETVFLLTNQKEYAIIQNYNTGGSALDSTDVIISKNKDELKASLSNILGGIRHDFSPLLESIPALDLTVADTIIKSKKTKIQ